MNDPRGLDNPALPEFDECEREGVIVRTTVFRQDFPHGGWTLGSIPRRSTLPLDWLAAPETAGRFAWPGAAFLDTETTSLSSGSGVVVFLTGIGAFEPEGFVVRQYLIRDPDREEATLQAIVDDLDRRGRLVTFFGKAFDQHRLLDRARYLGLPFPLPEDHFDLYWMSRRLVGGRFADLKLRTLEHELLGYYRLHDLPGSEAPEAWFRALRGEGDTALEGVMMHNLIDVVSLASLAAELSLRLEAPSDRDERLARARVLVRAGERGRGCEELTAVVDRDSPAELWRELALLRRRVGDYSGQRSALESALCREPEDLVAHVELAKWFEHRGRDPARALELAEGALGLIGRVSAVSPTRVRVANEAALRHRIERLRSRLDRSREVRPSGRPRTPDDAPLDPGPGESP